MSYVNFIKRKMSKLLHVAGRMCVCVRCTSAYHVGGFCIAAGSRLLGDNRLLCPSHSPASTGVTAHCNVNWCFLCCRGHLSACKNFYHFAFPMVLWFLCQLICEFQILDQHTVVTVTCRIRLIAVIQCRIFSVDLLWAFFSHLGHCFGGFIRSILVICVNVTNMRAEWLTAYLETRKSCGICRGSRKCQRIN